MAYKNGLEVSAHSENRLDPLERFSLFVSRALAKIKAGTEVRPQNPGLASLGLRTRLKSSEGFCFLCELVTRVKTHRWQRTALVFLLNDFPKF